MRVLSPGFEAELATPGVLVGVLVGVLGVDAERLAGSKLPAVPALRLDGRRAARVGRVAVFAAPVAALGACGV